MSAPSSKSASPKTRQPNSNARHLRGVSSFELFNETFEVPDRKFQYPQCRDGGIGSALLRRAMPEIQKALAEFKGIKRRQEVRAKCMASRLSMILVTIRRPLRDAGRTARPLYQIQAFGDLRAALKYHPAVIFQHELPKSFAQADGVFLSRCAHRANS
jgi:hypothetical protein